MELFSNNCARLCEALRSSEGGVSEARAVVVLQGGESKTRYCSDTEEVFRQVELYIENDMFRLLTLKAYNLYLDCPISKLKYAFSSS